MRGLGSIEALEFQSLRFVFSSEAEEGVEDAFEGLRGARPDAGKGLAMNRQFADQVANRVGGRDRHRSESDRCPWAAEGCVLGEGAGWPGLASGR